MSTGRLRSQCVSPNYPTEQFCTVVPPFWHPQFKVAAVYPLPWGINASANLQNLWFSKSRFGGSPRVRRRGLPFKQDCPAPRSRPVTRDVIPGYRSS